MNQLNNIIFEGTLINDPEKVAKSTVTGDVLVKFTISNDRFYTVGDQLKMDSIFMVCQCWGELGEKAVNSLKEGMLVRAVGRLVMERWLSPDGTKKTAVEILCNHIEFRAKDKGRFKIIREEENNG